MDTTVILIFVDQMYTSKKGSFEYALFVILKRALDSVQHEILWTNLLSLVVNPKVIHTLRNLYDCGAIKISLNGEASAKIDVTQEVLQEDSLSPLFILS